MLMGRPEGNSVLSDGPGKFCGPLFNKSIVGMYAVIKLVPLENEIIASLGFGPQHRPRNIRGVHVIPVIQFAYKAIDT